MFRQSLLYSALAIFLLSCTTTPKRQYAGAIKHAKQDGRSLVVFGIHHGSPSFDRAAKAGSLYYGLSVGVAFITTGTTTLKSVAFDFLPYSANGDPLPRKTKRFIAKKPMRPNHVYRVVGPKIVWSGLSIHNCLKLVGMLIRGADGTITRVNKKDINHYVTPNVMRRWSTGCVQFPSILRYRGKW